MWLTLVFKALIKHTNITLQLYIFSLVFHFRSCNPNSRYSILYLLQQIPCSAACNLYFRLQLALRAENSIIHYVNLHFVSVCLCSAGSLLYAQ
jgi:hypothetical protein